MLEDSIKVKTGNKRNSNIELLRFILMIAICVWHTYVHGFDYKNMSCNIIPGRNDLLFMEICAPAVDTFILISGYYGIKFSYEKMSRYILLALLISNLVYCIRFLFFGGSLSFYNQILPVSSGFNWWFLNAYIVIFLLSPIINLGIDQIEKKLFRNLLFALFFIYFIVQYQLGMGGANFTIMFLLYLLGRYLKLSKIKLSRLQSCSIYFFSLLLLYGIIMYYYYKKDYPSIWHLLNYNNPAIVLIAVSILYYVLSFERKPISNISFFLGRHSLSIYLFSEIIGVVLYKYWAGLLNINTTYFLSSVILFSFLVECVDVFLHKVVVGVHSLILRVFYFCIQCCHSSKNTN